MERERDRPPRNDGMMMMSSGAATFTQEACEKCYRHGRLEISITGREKLCKSCMIEQFEYYKKQRIQYCGEIEKLAEFYRRKIESLNPVIQSNLQQINQVADQIEESYSAALNLLNKQKIELMALLNDCKKDNTRFTDFKNQLNVVLANMDAFKDPSQNLYEDNVIKSLVNKFEQSLQVSQTIERTYQSLINQPVRYVERYERGPSLAPNKKYLGQVFIMDSASGASLPTVPVPASATVAPAAATAPIVSSAVAGNARTSTGGATNPTTSKSMKDTKDDLRHSNAALQHMALTEREHNYEKWLKRTSETPYMVAQFDKEPSFVAAYRNLVFVVNPRSELTMITISSSDELQVRETYQIPLPNIRSVAVNANYFAVSYSDLDKATMKRNNYKKHGINLYERTSDFVDFNLERKFELDTGEFIYPVGIALDSDFIYVCDKGLKAVIKMDIMRGNTVARVDFPKGYPYKLAVNRDFLVVTDPAQHLLNVYDARTLRFVRNLCVEQPKAKNGPFSVYLTDDNTIFFKNYADSQLTIVDINLNKHMVFSQISTSIEGFTVAECFNNHKVLVIGSTIKNKDYRLITYFIN